MKTVRVKKRSFRKKAKVRESIVPSGRSAHNPFVELFDEAASAASRLQSNPFWPPLSDPQQEKIVFETCGPAGWIEWLRKAAVKRALLSHPVDEAKRIGEVYRLCFEELHGSDLTVVSDFVAHCPRTVLSGTWLSTLVERPRAYLFIDPKTSRNRVFKAISDGFRRAASSVPSTRGSVERALLPVRIECAREMQRQKRSELDDFFRRLDAKNATEDWLNGKITAKHRELVSSHPRLAPTSDKLREHMEKRRAYKASILIAAKVFSVRERDLQDKAD